MHVVTDEGGREAKDVADEDMRKVEPQTVYP
jgi:hypothetical protein